MTDEASPDRGSEGDEEEAQEAEPLRVLMGSPIGRLAIEFRDNKVTSLIIQPDRKQARKYKSLDKIKMTDFLLEALGSLSEHLAGLRGDAGLEIDLGRTELSDFARRVLRHTGRIQHGRTMTYKKLAESTGRPDAYRVVQAVLAQNPIPILIPCHRVIPSKGGVGGYIGGTKKKEKLLSIEARSLGG